jgi:hypothetical protein
MASAEVRRAKTRAERRNALARCDILLDRYNRARARVRRGR